RYLNQVKGNRCQCPPLTWHPTSLCLFSFGKVAKENGERDVICAPVMYECCVGGPPCSRKWPAREVGCECDSLIDERKTTPALHHHLNVCRRSCQARRFRPNPDFQ